MNKNDYRLNAGHFNARDELTFIPILLAGKGHDRNL
jgi:hypothetical protein